MNRRDYIFRKFGLAVLTLAVVVVVDFYLFRVLPGDPVRAVIGRNVRISKESQDALRAQFGLDRPLHEQFIATIAQWAQGNFGISWSQRKPVGEILLSKLGNTLMLISLGQVFSIVLGVSLGLFAGWKRKTAIDIGLLSFSLVAWAIPTFWLGIILLAAGSTWLGLPTGGALSPENLGKPFWETLPDRLRHLILPTLTFTIVYLGEYMLIMRSSVLEVLSEDYILTAKAKGMSHWQVLRHHALKNAMLPIVTLIALNLGFTVAGAIYIETVFSYDGLGKLFQDALDKQDFPLLQGAFLLLAVAVIGANFLADLLYAYLDPRVKAA
ncbi:MAG: ABC transporter permease [Anaerolineales bacterium]|nr:ABC transporter permease [Anaerolineales bacterium]